MKFHPDKCQVLTITRKKEPIHFDYVLHGHKLEHVQTAKYLGVTRRAPMWQQSGTLQFCSCHGIAGFLVDELEI